VSTQIAPLAVDEITTAPVPEVPEVKTSKEQDRIARRSQLADKGAERCAVIYEAIANHKSLNSKVLTVYHIGQCVWARLNGWPSKPEMLFLASFNLHWNSKRKRFVDYNGYKPYAKSPLSLDALMVKYGGNVAFGTDL
jgi:hypothetical protein